MFPKFPWKYFFSTKGERIKEIKRELFRLKRGGSHTSSAFSRWRGTQRNISMGTWEHIKLGTSPTTYTIIMEG
jgi:hypothetical protein